MKKNPAMYDMPLDLPTEEAFDEAIERHPVRSTLMQLAHHGLVCCHSVMTALLSPATRAPFSSQVACHARRLT